MKHEKSTTLFVSEDGKIVERGRLDIEGQDVAFVWFDEPPKKWDPDLKQPPSRLAIGLLWGMMGALTASFYWVAFIWWRY